MSFAFVDGSSDPIRRDIVTVICPRCGKREQADFDTLQFCSETPIPNHTEGQCIDHLKTEIWDLKQSTQLALNKASYLYETTLFWGTTRR